ncbi:cytochrome P450 71D445-like [Euphorbia lathyris]|uniref:cytochrome P450 71D445-like n=1 Tax=Euphorbia lathyris TaxID=212925 RepID=UPI0033142986
MESQFLSSSSNWPIISMTTLIFLVLIWKKFRTKTPNPKLPPGPWKLPIIGSMHHLIGCLPHEKLRDLAIKHGPIMHIQLGELTNIIISSPKIAKEVLKDHDVIFAERPLMLSAKTISYDFKDISFAPYGDYWRQLRKITTMELLNAKRVRSFRSIREDETSKLVRLISSSSNEASGSAINFSSLINSSIYCMTSRAAFGKIWEGENVFLTCLETLITEFGRGISIADAYPSIKWLQMFSRIRARVDKLHHQIDQIFQNILDEHRSAKKGQQGDQLDLVDVLLNLQEKGDLEFPLTDETIKAVIMDIFIAGVDTSSTTIEWMMAELMKNPRVMEKTQEEIRKICDAKGRVDEADLQEFNYLKLVVKEDLRLHPPAPLMVPRECRESCVIDGYDIPVKSKIMVNLWAMGRDNRYWDEPEEFKPERFQGSSVDYKGNNFEYIPFGAGRRICPGMAFGIANVELPLAKLLYHFDWKLIDGLKPENLDMTEVIGSSSKRKSDLCIIPIPYLPPTSTN